MVLVFNSLYFAAAETALEHMERAQVIADIQDEGFMPSHFSSTRSTKTAEPPKTSWPSVCTLFPLYSPVIALRCTGFRTPNHPIYMFLKNDTCIDSNVWYLFLPYTRGN